MSVATSSRNGTTSEARTIYRDRLLSENFVFFLDHLAFMREPLLRQFQKVAYSLIEALRTALDRSVVISTERLESLSNPRDIPTYQDNGYSSSAIIDKAIDLRLSVRGLESAYKNQWVVFFITEVWNFFQMSSTFAFTQDLAWARYDDAMMQLVSPRAGLSAPKPDMAFGLHYNVRDPVYKKLSQWKDKSIPSIDAYVTSKLAMPFLMFESKSYNGSLRTGENQLANSMVKAHDILCSLDLKDDLYVLGIVQVQFAVHFYMSFSTRQIDKDGKAFTDSVYLVKIDSCFLDEFQGCLRCLKFVEWAKSYGLGVFKNTVESALNRP